MEKSLLLAIFALLISCLVRLSCERQEVPKKQIIATKLNSTSVKVNWENFRKQKQLRSPLCPPQFYEIKLRSDVTKQIKSWRISPTQSSITITDVIVGKSFSVKVVTFLCDGIGTLSTKWHKKTAKPFKTTLRPPSSVTVLSFDNNIFIKWLPPEDQGQVEGYVISYGEEVPDIFFKHIPSFQLNTTLNNLKFSTQYVIGVRSFKKNQRSEAVFKVLYTRNKPAFGLETPKTGSSSLLAPTNLRLKTLSARSVLLQWSDPSLYEEQRISDERFYGVYYNNVNSGRNSSIVVKALQVTIYDLEPNQWYTFKVRTVKGILISPFTEEVVGKTLKRDANLNSAEFPLKKPSSKIKFERDKNAVAKSNRKQSQFFETKSKRHQKPATFANPESPKIDTPEVFQDQSEEPMNLETSQQVQVRVDALITWPKSLPSAQPSCSTQKTLYMFRYKLASDPDDQYITSNHTDNFKLLENLEPFKSYKYQVRYSNEEGDLNSWSQESMLSIPLAT